jgi:hypothetical protein
VFELFDLDFDGRLETRALTRRERRVGGHRDTERGEERRHGETKKYRTDEQARRVRAVRTPRAASRY